MQRRRLEIKVAILVLVAGSLVAGLVWVISGFATEKRFKMYVDFNNPLWISEGAMVKVSGIEAGEVDEIAFLGGQLDPSTNRRVYVRLTLLVDEKVRGVFRADAQFYIASQGLLGPQYIEIDPGTFEAPPFDFSKAALGNDPPRLEKVMFRSHQMMNRLERMLEAPDQDIHGLLDTILQALRSFERTMSAVADTLQRSDQDITKLVANLAKLADEVLPAVQAARRWLEEGGKVDLILSDVRAVTQNLPRQVEKLVAQLETTAARTDRLVAQVEEILNDTMGESQRRQMRATIANVETVSRQAVGVADDVRSVVAGVRGTVEPMFVGMQEVVAAVKQIVRNIQRGEGTVGALVVDEQIYDDLKELMRDLKHNPWKFFWRE